jgi:hypothetical protein
MPSWKSMHWSLSKNWVGAYFTAQPIDRDLKPCDSNCIEINPFLSKGSMYRQNTVTLYLQMKNQINSVLKP